MNKSAAAIIAGTAMVLGGFLFAPGAGAGTGGGYGTTTTTHPVTSTTKVTYPTSTTKVTYPSTTTSSMHVTTTTHKPTTTTSSTMKPTTTTAHETTTTKESSTTTSSTMATTSTTGASTTTTTAANMTLLTLRATVINTHGGTATVDDFSLEAAGPVDIQGITGAPAVTLASVPPGSFTLRDRVLVAAALGYTSSGWSCIGSADQTPSSVVLDAGEDAVCAITFADAAAPGSLIVNKVLNGNAVGQQGEIDIQATCNGFAFDPIVIPAGATGPVISTPFFGQGAGVSCTVTETVDGSKAGITVAVAGSPQTVTIVSGGPVTANITDTVNTAEATTTVAGATTTVAGAVTTVPGATTTATTVCPTCIVPTGAEITTGAETVTPAAATSTGSSLPFTGYDPQRMLEVAGTALILGGAGVALARRKRQD